MENSGQNTATAFTKADALEYLRALRDRAAAANRFAAAVAAEVARGRLAGFYQQRREVIRTDAVQVTIHRDSGAPCATR